LITTVQLAKCLPLWPNLEDGGNAKTTRLFAKSVTTKIWDGCTCSEVDCLGDTKCAPYYYDFHFKTLNVGQWINLVSTILQYFLHGWKNTKLPTIFNALRI